MPETQRKVLETKRILVALDASSRGRAALEAAVRLAIETSAELQGLYVEDEDLVRLASLPFAREVDFTSASTRPLRAASMERELQAAAQEAQRAFAGALQRLDLNWTFRVVRGTVPATSLAAAGDVDLLVIGQQGRSSRMMTGGFLPTRPGRQRRVVAVFDGSPAAFRAIELASRLVEQDSGTVAILVLASNGRQHTEQCLAWLQQHSVRAEINQVLRPSEQTIIDYVRKYPAAVLLINRDSECISDLQICRLVDEFDCPIVLC